MRLVKSDGGSGRNILAGCGLLVLAAAGLAAYEIYFAGPAVYVESRGNEKVIDLHFLGEYCIGVSHLRLRDCSNGAVVWEVQATQNTDDTGICTFVLRAGDNPVRVDQPAELQFIIIQPSGPTFRLRGGTTYDLTVWGNNGFAHWNITRRRIRL